MIIIGRSKIRFYFFLNKIINDRGGCLQRKITEKNQKIAPS